MTAVPCVLVRVFVYGINEDCGDEMGKEPAYNDSRNPERVSEAQRNIATYVVC